MERDSSARRYHLEKFYEERMHEALHVQLATHLFFQSSDGIAMYMAVYG